MTLALVFTFLTKTRLPGDNSAQVHLLCYFRRRLAFRVMTLPKFTFPAISEFLAVREFGLTVMLGKCHQEVSPQDQGFSFSLYQTCDHFWLQACDAPHTCSLWLGSVIQRTYEYTTEEDMHLVRFAIMKFAPFIQVPYLGSYVVS